MFWTLSMLFSPEKVYYRGSVMEIYNGRKSLSCEAPLRQSYFILLCICVRIVESAVDVSHCRRRQGLSASTPPQCASAWLLLHAGRTAQGLPPWQDSAQGDLLSRRRYSIFCFVICHTSRRPIQLMRSKPFIAALRLIREFL